MVTSLCQDERRNQLLVLLIRKMLAQPQRQGLLLSSRVAHLKTLYKEIGTQYSEIYTGRIQTDKLPGQSKVFKKN